MPTAIINKKKEYINKKKNKKKGEDGESVRGQRLFNITKEFNFGSDLTLFSSLRHANLFSSKLNIRRKGVKVSNISLDTLKSS